MGEVYKAYDTDRNRYVALKLLPEALAGDPEYVKRFQRESHVVARLREPHVIPIHDFGEIDGQLFIDMRLVDGADVGALLNKDGRIAPERAVHLISQVAQALDAAHADHLVHYDIKPSNILVTASDFVYVVDFGTAGSIGGQQTSLAVTGATIGTLHYMAPERFAGGDADGRADVYALACVLHECLTGAPPFSGKDLPALIYAQLHSGPPQASGLVEDVPPALDAVIACGMAKDPKDRFPSAGVLAAAAREALLTKTPTPLAPTAPPQAPAWTEITWTELPAPARQAATALAVRQDVTEPPGPAAEPAGSRSASRVPDSPTQTVIADRVGDRGSTRSPAHMPPGGGPDPDGDRLLPGGAARRPAREPGRRRLGVLLLAAVAALAIPIVLILLASARPSTPGATRTGTAEAARSVPRIAVPTVAGKVRTGPTPSYVQVAPNGKFAYIANPGAGVITVLSTATDLVSKTIKIRQGPPQYVSFSPDSRTAYVSVFSTKGAVHLIAFVDTATGTVTATVTVNNHTPGPSATSPGGRFLYVPNHNTAMHGSDENAVDVINTASRKLVGTIAVPANPHWVAFGKNGRIYTTDHMSATVTVINSRTNAIIREIVVGETPHSEALSPDGSRLAVTSFDGNEVFIVSTATDQVVASIPVGRNPLDVAYSPDGRSLYTVNNEDNTVTVIDTADNRVIAAVRTGKGPTSISVLPNGRQAYVTDENGGNVEILNLPK